MPAPTRLVVYRVGAAAEDELIAALWLAGVLGCEELRRTADRVELAASFPLAASPPTGPALPAGAEHLGETVQPDEDWLERWRSSAQAREVGSRFLVDPREPADAPDAAAQASSARRVLLRVPARTAFGTGSHESTRLALELLEEVDVAGRRVLDVGTGSGVLAFAAARLGAAWVAGHDNDFEAALLAGQHARLNGVAPALFAGTLAALAPSIGSAARRFELALVNILPEVILRELPALLPLLAADATVILSGILAAQGEELLAALAPSGLRLEAERGENDWVAYRLRSPA